MTRSAVDGIVHSFPVGRRTCTVTVAPPGSGSVVNMEVEWDPGMPRSLTGGTLRQYRRGRAMALAKFAERMDGPVVVIEV